MPPFSQQDVPEWVLVVGVPHVGHLVLYWVVVGLVTYVDRTDRPAFISKHRIQSGPRRQPNIRKVLTVLVPSIVTGQQQGGRAGRDGKGGEAILLVALLKQYRQLYHR